MSELLAYEKPDVKFTIFLDVCNSYSWIRDLKAKLFKVGQNCCLVSR